jgi:hypothetical protein
MASTLQHLELITAANAEEAALDPSSSKTLDWLLQTVQNHTLSGREPTSLFFRLNGFEKFCMQRVVNAAGVPQT